MDFFDNVNSFTDVARRLEAKKKEMNRVYNINITILIGGALLIAFMVSFLMYQDGVAGPIAIPWVLFFGLIPISILMKKYVLNKNVRMKYLNPEVFKLYNYYENTNFIYNGDLKNDNSFNKQVGLYNRSAGAVLHYHVTQKDNETLNYSFYDTTLTVSTGNSAQVVFDGIYLTINISTDMYFHLKNKKIKTGTKNKKFYNIKHPEYNVFLTEDDYDVRERHVIRKLEQKYFNIMEFTRKVFETDKIDIGSDKNTLIVGINKQLSRKIPKNLSEEEIRNYYEDYIANLRKIQSVVDYVYGLNS